MKILIPVGSFGNAGGYRVLSELATHWCAAGASVDFLVDARFSTPYFPTKAGIHKYNTSGVISGQNFFNKKTYLSIKSLSISYGMYKALNQIGHKYDIILANQSLTALPVKMSSIESNKKFYYIQAYEPDFFDNKNMISRSFVLKILSRFSYSLNLFHVVNSPIYLNYKEIKSEYWIPPGIDKVTFSRRKNIQEFKSSKKITIGTIGRKEEWKGTADVLDAFEALSFKDDRFYLKVAFGNLPEKWSHEKCEVVVPKSDHELAEFYRSVDILVAVGRIQLGACHYPVIESMSCGTPVVTTGYMPANNENSWIVPISSPVKIVQAIMEIVNTDSVPLSRKLDLAAKNIENFCWERVSSDFLRVFSSKKLTS